MFDYFRHVLNSDYYEPRIYFTPDSVWNENNPWIDYREYLLNEWNPHKADLLFLAGMDWASIPAEQRSFYNTPVINLIQGFRHANPDNIVNSFLSNKAIRICVSREVEKAVLLTGKVNGPIFTIPNGLDTTTFPEQKPVNDRTVDLLIVGTKKPDLALQIEQQICNLNLNKKTHTVTDLIPRKDFLDLLSDSKVAVFLPFEKEGFYLPPLEGMALGTVVICPDCLGNRSFCKNGINSIIPPYSLDGIMASVKAAFSMDQAEHSDMPDAAKATCSKHSIDNEHQSFIEILTSADKLWE